MTLPRVLTIEDSPIEAHHYRRVLEKCGYDVETAADGETGTHQALANRPDAILMDIVMPDVSGMQAARELHKNVAKADTPIINITSKSHETGRIWGMRQGALAYPIKLVKNNLLVKRVLFVTNQASKASVVDIGSATRSRR